MAVNPAIRLPRRRGPASQAGPVFLTATRFVFASHAAALLAAPHSLRFWATWHDMPGAIWLSVRYQPLTRAAWTLTAWAGASDLAGFLRSPAHRAVVAAFEDRLVGTSHRWETTDPDLSRCWGEAIHALESV